MWILTALKEFITQAFSVFKQDASSQPNGMVVVACLFSIYFAVDSVNKKEKLIKFKFIIIYERL